jgi:hypothetical protein
MKEKDLTLARFKICPACGCRNPENEPLCSDCVCDISGVASLEKNENTGQKPADSAGAVLVKICPECKAANPDYALICDCCMADLSGVLAGLPSGNAPAQGAGPYAENDLPGLVLRSKKDGIVIAVTAGGVLGRCDRCSPPRSDQPKCSALIGDRDNIDCVKFNTVSRRHARFVFENGDFYIIPLPEAVNKTFLNGAELERGSKHIINSGDRIGFSSKLELEAEVCDRAGSADKN